MTDAISATQTAGEDDIAAIAAVARLYFDGTHYSDGNKMAQAFAEGCQIIGKTKRAERDDWIEGVRRRVSPASRGAPYDYRIQAIEVTGDIATARLLMADTVPLGAAGPSARRALRGWRSGLGRCPQSALHQARQPSIDRGPDLPGTVVKGTAKPDLKRVEQGRPDQSELVGVHTVSRMTHPKGGDHWAERCGAVQMADRELQDHHQLARLFG